MKGIIIQGSSRSNGNTNKIIQEFNQALKFTHLDLRTKRISYYDYDHNNLGDDFIEVMKTIVENHETLIIATPVYWYAMSGLVKVFIDRITDCLKIEKDIGRKLRGMNMAVIACGSDDIEVNGFFQPFVNSAEYLGMNYLGHVHTWLDEDQIHPDVIQRLDRFRKLF